MKILYYLIPAIFLAGCNDITISTQKDNGICLQEPKWVTNPPNEKNAVYGVGVAPENFNGFAAQRKSAIAKAINEIAVQLNTNVNSVISYNVQVHNKSTTQDFQTASFQTINNEHIKATIVKSCKNPRNGYFYVLMKTIK